MLLTIPKLNQRSVLCATLAALFCIASNVGAISLHFLQYDPVSQLTDEDWALEGQAFLKAVNGPVSGQAIAWSNEVTGNSGTIKVLESFVGPEGEPCRKIQEDFQSRKLASSYTVAVCKIGEDWRVVSANPDAGQ